MDDTDVEVQGFWEGISPEQRKYLFENDAVLRFFDDFSVSEIAEGKLVKFDVDKIADLQDRVDKYDVAPEEQDKAVRDIFAPGATKNMNVRSHKLVAAMKDRLKALCEMGESAIPAISQEQDVDGGSPSKTTMETRAPPSGNNGSRRYLCLSSQLPEHAQINVRSEPHPEGEIVGVVTFSDLVMEIGQRQGEWAQIQLDDFGPAWVLTAMPDMELLVEAPPPQQDSQPPPQAPSQQQHHSPGLEKENNRAPQNHPQKQFSMGQKQLPQTYPAAPRTPMQQSQQDMFQAYQNNPALTPTQNQDPDGYVTVGEYNRLRFKVAQLEADMRALRLLLRSWSLDGAPPSQY